MGGTRGGSSPPETQKKRRWEKKEEKEEEKGKEDKGKRARKRQKKRDFNLFLFISHSCLHGRIHLGEGRSFACLGVNICPAQLNSLSHAADAGSGVFSLMDTVFGSSWICTD